MFSLGSFLVRTKVSLFLLLALALEAPGQSHPIGHLYAIDGLFVYLLNPEDGSLTHLYPSLFGDDSSGALPLHPSVAHNPNSGIWYATASIGAPADKPNVNYLRYCTFNPESQALRTVRTWPVSESETTGGNGGLAYNPADGHLYLLQGYFGQGGWHLEKIDPPTGKIVGETPRLATEPDVSFVGSFTFDPEGSLWALIERLHPSDSTGSYGSWELVKFDLGSGAQVESLTLATMRGNEWDIYSGGLVYDSQKHVFYTHHASSQGNGGFGIIDARNGTFTPVSSSFAVYLVGW